MAILPNEVHLLQTYQSCCAVWHVTEQCLLLRWADTQMAISGTHLNSWTDLSNVEIAPHRLVNTTALSPASNPPTSPKPQSSNWRGCPATQRPPGFQLQCVLACSLAFMVKCEHHSWSYHDCRVMFLLKTEHVNDFTQKHFHRKNELIHE